MYFQDHDAHGPEFLKLMKRINQETGANITVSDTQSCVLIGRSPDNLQNLLNISLRIQPPHIGFLVSPVREVSVIQAKQFHTDDVNMTRTGIASEWFNLFTKCSLKTSAVSSQLTLST